MNPEPQDPSNLAHMLTTPQVKKYADRILDLIPPDSERILGIRNKDDAQHLGKQVVTLAQQTHTIVAGNTEPVNMLGIISA